MKSTTFVCAAAALAMAAGTACADQQSFIVNAQYRGVVKKAFTDIGNGELNDSGRGASFRVQGRADVEHPQQKNKRYHLDIDMAFRQAGGTIQETANNSRCNPGSEAALSTTEKLIPFAHIAKWLPEGEMGAQTFNTPRGTFTLSLAQTERNLEATITENGRMAGKFFLVGSSVPRRIEKFRITTHTGTVLSFVATPNVASTRE